jgi:hypothetical protein
VAKDVLDLLPIKISKVQNLNQEDSFADQMKSLNTMKSASHRRELRFRIIELFAKYLQRNRGGHLLNKKMNFNMVCLSLKQALVCNPDDVYEFSDREIDEEIKEAELEGLDDFLLSN